MQKEHAIHTDAMKHAILILAHKNIGQLCRLVEYLSTTAMYSFI